MGFAPRLDAISSHIQDMHMLCADACTVLTRALWQATPTSQQDIRMQTETAGAAEAALVTR